MNIYIAICCKLDYECKKYCSNMSASTSASPPKRGRPNFEAETRRIRLRPDVFDRWLVKNLDLTPYLT